MSALDLVPASTRDLIATRPGSIRPDLAIIPAAEDAGWTVRFGNDRWQNAADFSRGNVHVWYAATRRGGIMWRRAILDPTSNRFRDHEWIAHLKDALEMHDPLPSPAIIAARREGAPHDGTKHHGQF